jgi:hypothetical protein
LNKTIKKVRATTKRRRRERKLTIVTVLGVVFREVAGALKDINIFW